MPFCNRIYISHASYLEAFHPDPEVQRKRDAFFAFLDEHFDIRQEGTDYVMDVPDVDLLSN